MPAMTQFPTGLARVLDEEGRTQKWLVEQLLRRGIRADKSQVSNWVRGLHVPVEPTREAIADILGRQIAWSDLEARAA
jgi:hypothetical protein